MGETVLNSMQEVLSQADTNILILDEWDANLDAANISKINMVLDKMAKSKCIFEVRHRTE